MTDLIHYSRKPVSFVYSVAQLDGADAKPRGFWFSVEDGCGWKEWCEGEDWGLDRLIKSNRLLLNPETPLLRLSSCDDIDQFHTEYLGKGLRAYTYSQIDWRRVAEKFSGIIIAPYQWERRLDDEVRWYYGWDCSSGCIWDANAVALIQA